ncbi:Nup133 N terminal like-domain-containing protein [Scheffersomyces coipomensis]|uniref:Nup133 N terminal like-domain-containing protein n=1 Tax=Scheffersomyces coipomensis TaxID=1788519 RepID=UPI00315C9F5B
MSFNTGSGSIFKARKRPQSNANSTSITGINDTHDYDDTHISKKSNSTVVSKSQTLFELTKNEQYCVSRLPALPGIFENDTFQSSILNGYSDSESNYSLVITENSLHVWNYKSTDSSPLSFQFPINDTNSNQEPIFPLAILTRPSNGISGQDPGLVIINSTTGLIKFYESVQHAPALGLINDKSLELTIPINSKRGEFITLAENIEPAGIAIATSWKRSILISLRDFKGKPKLSILELISPTTSNSIISNLFFGNKSSDNNLEINNEIISIKSGKITNHGMTQEIIIQDSNGGFYFFIYNLSSANGIPYIDKKYSYKHNLTPYVENSIDGFIPGSSLTINFLDLWPLLQYEKTYLGLCHIIDNNDPNGDSKNLLLITIKIDSTGGLLYGSHKLIRYNPSDSTNPLITKPKLFLPKPGHTAFVTIDNSVIITDINTSYINDSTSGTVSYYKPRWEDIIQLKSDVQIIGYGFENKSPSANPSIVIITKNFGVLRLERFPEAINDDELQAITDPIFIIKSHIEQGIFFAGSSQIEFDINSSSINISDDLILKAVDSIISEIINSTSPYLPEFLPSIIESLNQKSSLYKELINYSKRNFSTLNSVLIPKIVEYLEKVEVALNLWIFINDLDNEQQQQPQSQKQSVYLKEILESIVLELNKPELQSGSDVIRKVCSQGIEYINVILTRFIDKLIQDSFSLTNLVELLIKTQYNGIFLIESNYIVNTGSKGTHKLWIFDTKLLFTIGDIYEKEYNDTKSNGIIITEKRQSNLIKLCEVLYYFVINAINYFEQNDSSNNKDELTEYKRWYKTNKPKWINALLKNNLSKDAIVLSEKYRDFNSLALILEFERSNIIEKYGANSKEHNELIKKYGQYFETFEYDFASSLYDYYLTEDKIQPLLLDFTNYKNYLKLYFEKNQQKTAKVAWIRQLLDKEFPQASESLLKSVKVLENLDNKELKYSLAKLAIIASKAKLTEDDIVADKSDEILNESEANLVQIRAQSKLLQSLLKYVNGEKKLLTLDYILKNHSNKLIEFSIRNQLIGGEIFNDFVENIQVSSSNLINLLTVIKPVGSSNKEFSEALKVASVINNESKYKYFTNIIWLRLLTITEDWSVISKLNSKFSTDEHIKDKIRKTVIFKTLSEIKLDHDLVSQLDKLLTTGKIDETNYEIDEEIEAFHQKLLVQLNDYNKNNELKLWIDSIKQEVKNSII